MDYYHIFATSKCPFCVEAIDVLNNIQQEYVLTLLDNSPRVLADVKKTYDWQTVPIITLHNTADNDTVFVGGCDDLKQYLIRERTQ